ncbi:15226_t:CDS:2 [Acaulospora colombiana]|uniref:15226_t:CDS:1 n=1 Tax=Acaulospora colombiana TaxID=27376 RepID=A0ACA9K6R5_9GLOM|nr:15226_t:CDS:2 [Acaulospora colombiana]
MSFLADFEPAIIHYPYDQDQRKRIDKFGITREICFRLFGRKKVNAVEEVRIENNSTSANRMEAAAVFPNLARSSTSRMKYSTTSPSETQFLDRNPIEGGHIMYFDFNSFKHLSVIARGAYGEVSKAYWNSAEKTVALKTLYNDLGTEEDHSFEDFIKEVGIRILVSSLTLETAELGTHDHLIN